MFVELIEMLRCPRDHEESLLVGTAVRTESRHIIEGTLGCPVCQAEFPIEQGEALFDRDATAEPELPDMETGMRLAAFLELTDARGYAILSGRWGAHAVEVRRLAATPLILVNPPRDSAVDASAVIRVRGRVPLARGSARAAALDMSDAWPASLIDAVRPGGRLVGPAAMELPPGVSELTRDARAWVGEKSAAPDTPAPRLVTLRRA